MLGVVADAIGLMVRELGTRAFQGASVGAGEVAFHHIAGLQHNAAELVHLLGVEECLDPLFSRLPRLLFGKGSLEFNFLRHTIPDLPDLTDLTDPSDLF